ncbi:putative copia-type polyprotein [Trifolium medium]|uniref:Putative copia-type polyprotein n=1 Tax=Trifolium medium TaxID=97028 RepID=A0A392M1F4_9FABA|nr:putative copia-type polyprotein [Trifolium medium]
MEEPRKSYMNSARRVLRYIARTLEFGILFPTSARNARKEIICYSDVDWCGDKIDRRCTTGYFFKFMDASVSWCSKKQPVELKVDVERPIKLQIDNKSSINLAKNPVRHGALCN